MPESLASALRKRRADSLLDDAQFVADYPAGPERIDHAEILVREAMVQRVLGRLTQEEEYRVFSILSFAMPEDACIEGENPPNNLS